MLNGIIICPASEEESVLLEKTLLEKGYRWVHMGYHGGEAKPIPNWWNKQENTCLRIELDPEKKWYQRAPKEFYVKKHMNIWTVLQFLEYYGGKL